MAIEFELVQDLTTLLKIYDNKNNI